MPFLYMWKRGNMKLKQIMLVFLILVWIIGIFCFSNQPSDDSSKTSGRTIRAVIEIAPRIKKMEEEPKQRLVEKLQHPARKIAHFSIYMLGGILLFLFMNTFQIDIKNKILYALSLGIIYATSDEIHQFYIPGRSCEFRDVCIDSTGVLVGILVVIGIYCIMRKVNRSHKRG